MPTTEDKPLQLRDIEPIPKLSTGENRYNLPSKPPFMWIERETLIDAPKGAQYALFAFGAYNACGLIGPERGGVAVCIHLPNGEKEVLATKTIAYRPALRSKAFDLLVTLVKGTKGSPKALLDALREEKFDVRY